MIDEISYQFQRIKFSPLGWFCRSIKHCLLDFFRFQLPENERFINLYANKQVTIIANGPSLRFVEDLPKSDVVICNHFWRHHHYHKITCGIHVVSDKKFLLAKDIDEFIASPNFNVVVFTTKYIGAKLRQRGFKGALAFLNYSGSRPVWNKRFELKSDLSGILQTGSTVVADFALPIVKYGSAKRVHIVGMDLDYGCSGKDYGFDPSNSITEGSYFLKNFWPQLAKASVLRWIEHLEANGCIVVVDPKYNFVGKHTNDLNSLR